MLLLAKNDRDTKLILCVLWFGTAVTKLDPCAELSLNLSEHCCRLFFDGGINLLMGDCCRLLYVRIASLINMSPCVRHDLS